ncbi:hypothetical protein [Myxosarcina sp. GI1]|uniref:hypothetical protein n=1 Tax=Myxosarcina sp. GI1 TaxID=1541065 RepID=UPI001C125896|nr:hypothetical protein [Myxosarcina sp. GI1]
MTKPKLVESNLTFLPPMMSITHCAIAAAGTSLILGTAEPLPLGLAIILEKVSVKQLLTAVREKEF